MYLKVIPTKNISGNAEIPSSKPETQRAIVVSSLADGTSIVNNDLRCLETKTMIEACRAVGAEIIERDGYLEIHGVGGQLRSQNKVIDALGSGLVFRVFAALTSFSSGPSIVTGDRVLQGRIMAPLFNALKDLGADISCINEEGKAPIANWGTGMRGGRCVIEGNLSSQFITAVLLAAPFAETRTEILITGEILSISYIKQTIETMKTAGIMIDASRDYSLISVQPGRYKSSSYFINGDYTSSSYLIVAAALSKGETLLTNITSESLQGERQIIDIIRTLGVSVVFDNNAKTVTVRNESGRLIGDYEFDASDCPNIVPTLGALGCYVEGTFKVTGGSITRLHKSPRIKAMVSELKKIGVDISPIYKDSVLDGFQIHGKTQYPGNSVLSSWGDHRIFMSLFVASLRCRHANYVDGYQDVHCSFPDFFEEFSRLGARFIEIDEDELPIPEGILEEPA